MKMNAALKYRLYEYRKSIFVFYPIILFVFLFFFFFFKVSSNGSFSFNGFELSSQILLFVMGINSFKESFKFFLQNGRSRRTVFSSFYAGMAITAMVVSLINTILLFFISKFTDTVPFYFISYGDHYPAGWNHLTAYMEGILFFFFMGVLIAVAGFFLSVLYYRMNTGLKIIVSVGVPMLVIFILPVLDVTFFQGSIISFLLKAFLFLSGHANGGCNPYIAMASCLGVSLLLSTFTYCMIRRIPIKD